MERIDELELKIKQQAEEIASIKESLRLHTRSIIPASVNITVPKELESLKMLLESEQWPNAVDPSLICNITSDQDKEDRAAGILEIIIDASLENKSLLDFGCGEGHVINRAISQKPKKVIGYDIQAPEKWSEFMTKNTEAKYTKDWSEVEKNGPYDVILLYDVLDHITNVNPVSVLEKIHNLMTPNTKIFVRCHPWTSRHATHLYHTINKAYIHLVFTENELEALGYKGLTVNKITRPFSTYREWFSNAKLKIVTEKSIKNSVEDFFSKNTIVKNRIKNNWRIKELRGVEGKKIPWQMELQFIDYVLSKS